MKTRSTVKRVGSTPLDSDTAPGPGALNYRKAAKPTGDLHVVWGPMPVRRVQLLVATVVAFLALIVAAAGADYGELTCTPNWCRWRRAHLVSAQPRMVPRALVREVRSVTGPGKDQLRLWLHYGSSRLSLGVTDTDQGLRFVTAANRDLRTGKSFAIRRRGRWPIAIAGLAALLAALVFIGRLLRRAGYVEIRGDRHRLDVTHRVLGIPFGRREIRTPNIADTGIEWSTHTHFFQGRHAPPESVARLFVELEGGARIALTQRSFHGYGCHVKAERALRQALELRPRSSSARVAFVEELRAHAPYVGPNANSAMHRFGIAWLGMCCGAIGGLVIFGTLGLVLGLVSLDDQVGDVPSLGAILIGAISGIALALRWSRPETTFVE